MLFIFLAVFERLRNILNEGAIDKRVQYMLEVMFAIRKDQFKVWHLDCVLTMPAHFENGEKCDGSRIRASVHTMPEQFENDTKFDSKNSLQDFDSIESTHTSNVDQSCSKSVEICAFFKCLHNAVSNMSVRVQFSKVTVFKMCRQKMCRFPVNRRPVRHIFYRFQNVPVSCERSLSCFVITFFF